jgi:hypothetical protein
MASWKDVEDAEPGFAGRVRALLDAHVHKTIATLRADGAPRISGIEVRFTDDGELAFGSMPGARKGADLHRDPRFALHGGSDDPVDGRWPGDAKVAGLAVPAGPVPGMPGEMFRADIREVVLTGLTEAGDMLRIETWSPDRGLRRIERA